MIARRQLHGGVEEEGVPCRERDAEGEPVGPLHRRVAARRENAVRIATRFSQRNNAQHSYEQNH